MLIYAGRKYTSTQIGSRLCEVCCEKCQTRYFYELVREGSGSEEAPYFLGQQRAAESATKQAQADVSLRLDREAELVPCPKCQWINEELVHGYRQTRYRRLKKLAFIIAFFGTVICVICGLYAGHGNMGPLNSAELIWWFVKGPAICIGGGLLCLVWQSGLRQLIKPNSMYPDKPTVPTGTPPALIQDAQTGEFTLANPEVVEDVSNHWITVQPGRVAFPEVCCSCLSPTEKKYQETGFDNEVPIPFCDECQLKLTQSIRQLGRTGLTLAILAGAGGMCLRPWIESSLWLTAIIALLAVPILAWFGLKQNDEFPILRRGADPGRKIAQVQFRNPDYTQLCLEQNRERTLSTVNANTAKHTHE